MNKIPFTHKYDLEYGKLEQLTPLIRRITARNPSGFTFRGTGTYVIGHGKDAVIDPGPLMPDHIEALKQCLKGEEVTHILITHTHMDHSPAAKQLKQFWQCKTVGYGPHGAGKIAAGVPIEEGGDMDFEPDIEVRQGDINAARARGLAGGSGQVGRERQPWSISRCEAGWTATRRANI